MSSSTLERLPPHSVEAEQGLIGCILLDPNATLALCAERRVLAPMFYDLRHAQLYFALVQLEEEKGLIDVVTLSEWLARHGKTEQVGGLSYVMSLQDIAPSATNAVYYLDILRGKWLLRKLLSITADAQRRLWEHTGSEEDFVLDVEDRISQLTEDHAAKQAEVTMRKVIADVVDDMEEHRMVRGKTLLRGLPLGKPGWYIDKMVMGLRENYYAVLAARPGDGKTSYAMNLAEYLALDYEWHERTGQMVKNAEGEDVPETRLRKGVPVAVFSLEMDEKSLGYRLLFSRANVDLATWNEGFPKKGANESLIEKSKELIKANIYIDSTPSQTIGQIAAKARRMVKQYGIKLFILDYLQLVELDHGSGMDRVAELTKVSRKIMSLGKQLKVPWLVLAQMNRNIETTEVKRPPQMSDLKDCGSIEQDAHVVIMLYRPELKRRSKKDDGPTDEELIESATQDVPWAQKPKRINAQVVKNRNGPTGRAEFVFSGNLQRFEDFHLWKVKHGLESLKSGEGRNLVL
jgi:replicative DNA helicase